MTTDREGSFNWAVSPRTDEHCGALPGTGGFVVRRTMPADEPALIRLLESVSSEEIRLRFFGHIRHFSHAMASVLMRSDDEAHLSLVVLLDDGAAPRIVANAMLVAAPDQREAEFAVLVHHDYAHHGLGRHLIECMLQHARLTGIGRVYGLVLADNTTMLELAHEMGFSVRSDHEVCGGMRVEISTTRVAQ